MRGLGFTDLQVMNDALLLKFLWRLASRSGALWVKVVKAKYLPRSELWLSKRLSRCTIFWKALMRLRESLVPWITWQIGDWASYNALAQPWFQEALDCDNQQNAINILKVKDLLTQDSGQWDVEKLVQLFGYVNTLHILQEIQPPGPDKGQDRLIFKHSTNGVLTVKKVCVLLSANSDMPIIGDKQIWDSIWHKGSNLPRVRVFIWKLMHDGLPLASTLHRRFPAVNTTCTTCGELNEDVNHLAHTCHLSRVCHFSGPIALKSDSLPIPFLMALQTLNTLLDDEQWTQYVNSLWAIWRCRNDKVYGGKEVGLDEFWKYYNAISWETLLRQAGSAKPVDVGQYRQNHNPSNFQFSCFMDGSWDSGWDRGIGICLMRNGELIQYRFAKVRGSCAIHVEALALKEAFQLVRSQGIACCIFYSDCKSLVECVATSSLPTNADWRAFSEIMFTWKSLHENQSWACMHIPRGQNELADGLSKLGRQQDWDQIGYTFPMFWGL